MKPYLDRRAKLLAYMQEQGGGVALLATSQEMTRNNDCLYPFRHDSYFYYLTGFTEPEAVLILVAGKTPQSILFCREKNSEREIWDGFRFGPEAAQQEFAFDAAYPINTLDTELARCLTDAPAIYHSSGYNNQLDARLLASINSIRNQSRSGALPPMTTHDVHAIIDEMRLLKDPIEIALMARAASISGIAHRRAMEVCRPGMVEYELEAELLHTFRRNGSNSPAYESIVAAGKNACVLHYSANNAPINEGDLVLIDAGCEFGSYASDITRTFPANGKFNAAQQSLYELVLAAQSAALERAVVGARYNEGHQAAIKVLTQGMLDLGLLNKDKVGNLDDAISNGDFRQFYMHGTGHWIGLDVHDVGNYREPHATPEQAEKPHRLLQPGMAITVEPGIYVRPGPGIPEKFWHIGIRIEDDIIVAEHGPLNLSQDTPKTVADIESVMRRK